MARLMRIVIWSAVALIYGASRWLKVGSLPLTAWHVETLDKEHLHEKVHHRHLRPRRPRRFFPDRHGRSAGREGKEEGPAAGQEGLGARQDHPAVRAGRTGVERNAAEAGGRSGEGRSRQADEDSHG